MRRPSRERTRTTDADEDRGDMSETIKGPNTGKLLTMRVNCTRNTVRNLQVELGESILCTEAVNQSGPSKPRPALLTLIYGGRTNIRDGSRFHHVPHGEALDGLILGHASSAVRAADKLNVTTSVLVAPSISSFRSLSLHGWSSCRSQIHRIPKATGHHNERSQDKTRE